MLNCIICMDKILTMPRRDVDIDTNNNDRCARCRCPHPITPVVISDLLQDHLILDRSLYHSDEAITNVSFLKLR